MTLSILSCKITLNSGEILGNRLLYRLFSLYVCVFFQILCRLGVSRGSIPHIPFFVELLYASATSILFHLGVVTPHKIKPSYWKFMNKITGDRYEHFPLNLWYWSPDKLLFQSDGNQSIPFGSWIQHIWMYSSLPPHAKLWLDIFWLQNGTSLAGNYL